MVNSLNTDIKSEIIDLQFRYLFSRLLSQLGDTVTKDQIMILVSETIQRYYVNLGRPLTIRRYAEPGHLPFIQEYDSTIDEMVADITILYREVMNVGNALATNFNYAQSERMRVENRIKNVESATNDLNLLANETTPNSLYMKDSFIDESLIEKTMIMGSPAQISTREGIVTLARTSSVNRSTDAKIKLIQGDGENGTAHLVRKVNLPTTNGTMTSAYRYIDSQSSNQQPEAILDGRPDTIFEYQSLSVDLAHVSSVTNNYDIAWAKGHNPNDKLRAKIVIELNGVQDVNWININPYTPEGSTGKVVVYSIRTSADGFDYEALYEDGNYIINAELNKTPQTYRRDEVFTGNNDFTDSKFAGQGVWSFATRKTKYVEIVFDQVEAYPELVGHTFYKKITVTNPSSAQTRRETSIRIPASQVPEGIINGEPGRYSLSETEYIEKGIETFPAMRRVIGIRDINIMSYQFEERSELVTQKFTLDKPIKEVMLYANEKIPESFLQDLTKANDWIQYFFSLDDVSWYEISPTHRSPVGGKKFSPKIFEINTSNVNLVDSFQLQKGYIKTEKETHSIRMKITLKRPSNIFNAASFTPILEDYSLRLIFEEGV